MAEPTDAVMPILQQIQDTLAEHTREHHQHSRRFDRIDRRRDEIHDNTITALGLAGHANIRHECVSERIDELTRRIEDLERTK